MKDFFLYCVEWNYCFIDFKSSLKDAILLARKQDTDNVGPVKSKITILCGDGTEKIVPLKNYSIKKYNRWCWRE